MMNECWNIKLETRVAASCNPLAAFLFMHHVKYIYVLIKSHRYLFPDNDVFDI